MGPEELGWVEGLGWDCGGIQFKISWNYVAKISQVLTFGLVSTDYKNLLSLSLSLYKIVNNHEAGFSWSMKFLVGILHQSEIQSELWIWLIN